MPVTAKLSRKFYERFGDEIADEFVNWFNAVDLTYQNQLREQNELNWQRFKAELRAESAAIRAEFHTALAQSEARLLEKLSDTRSDLMKWMFIYWTGTVISLGGLMLALSRR